MPKFVLSSSDFDTIKEAEKKIDEWHNSGTLESDTKLYKVTEVYNQKLKFSKRRKK